MLGHRIPFSVSVPSPSAFASSGPRLPVDHLIRLREQRLWDGQPERPRGLQMADQLGYDVADSLDPSLVRSALQDEVLSVRIAVGPQALHERRDGVARLRSDRWGDGNPERDEADTVDLFGLLRIGGRPTGRAWTASSPGQ